MIRRLATALLALSIASGAAFGQELKYGPGMTTTAGNAAAAALQALYNKVSVGTSQFMFKSWPALLEFNYGTSGSPITLPGSSFKISRTENIQSSSCNDNKNDTECNSGLLAMSVGLTTTTQMTSGITGGAKNASTTAGTDAVGLIGLGDITGSGVGIGTGAYLQGRRDTATALALGAEIRSQNVTSSNCSYAANAIGVCDGLWISSGSDGVHNTTLSSALHVGASDAFSKWNAGLTINAGAVSAFGVDDQSSGTTSINIGGTHTHAINVAAGGGDAVLNTIAQGTWNGSTIGVAYGGTGDTGSAWTPFTPTITCTAGTITTSSGNGHYKTIGKSVFVSYNITMPNIGSCATGIQFSLPVAANFPAVLVGRENAASGAQLQGNINNAGTTVVSITNYANSFVLVNGYQYILSGVYEGS